MTGNTGYTAPTAASTNNPPSDMADIYSHFDAYVGEKVSTASSLPSSGAWVGRTITAADTGIVYVCTAAPGTWKKIVAVDDTGWLSVTAKSGFTNSSGQVRVKNGILFLDGTITKNSGNYTTGDSPASLPSAVTNLFVRSTIRMTGWAANGTTLLVNASTSGLAIVGSPASATLIIGGSGPVD